MPSTFFIDPRLNPELRSLNEIILLPQQSQLQDYFLGVIAILSEYFPIRYSALFLESRQPMAILNLSQEPLYEEIVKSQKRIERIQPPLLCIPLVTDDEPMGVINVNPLYGARQEFVEDFQFLSVLSTVLSPVIKNYQLKKGEILPKDSKLKARSHLLDEILEQKLAEVLNKIDPYVEIKTKMGIFDDIIRVVEKILIKSALERVDHVQIAAAQLLGINRNTLRKKMKEMKIKVR
jgi:DNA-binding protein Fis